MRSSIALAVACAALARAQTSSSTDSAASVTSVASVASVASTTSSIPYVSPLEVLTREYFLITTLLASQRVQHASLPIAACGTLC